ncbi:MAG: KH domain-containing protein, partial [Candidatus Saccharimonadales bacterium]
VLGRVIGKRGATAQSLRTLLRALGTKNDARYNLKIIDNGEGGYNRGAAASAQPTTASDDDGSKASADDSADITPAADTVIEPSGDKTPENRDQAKPANDDGEDVVSKTRKELEDYDDLDI